MRFNIIAPMLQTLLTILVILTFSTQAQTYRANRDQLPLLEAGAGVVWGTTPHYPGSDEHTTIVVPFPTFQYRGDVVRADEDGGLRTRYLFNDNAEINLSIGGSLPVSSDDNDEREGMPKLNTILEFGPGLIVHFVPKEKRKKFRLSLNVPVRLAVSTDLKLTKERGIVFNPLLYGFYSFTRNFTLFAGLSGRWVSQKYNAYLYDVASNFETANRETYQASSGYVQTTLGLGAIFNFKDYSMFLGYSFDDASQSSNSNSPLFVKDQSYSAAVGITWWFYELYK